MDFSTFVIVISFIYTTFIIIICLLITQSFVFLLLIIINIFIFLFLSREFVKKYITSLIENSGLTTFFSEEYIKEMYCKWKKWI